MLPKVMGVPNEVLKIHKAPFPLIIKSTKVDGVSNYEPSFPLENEGQNEVGEKASLEDASYALEICIFFGMDNSKVWFVSKRRH